MKKQFPSRLLAVFILAFPVLVLIGFFIYDDGTETRPPLPAMPSPNGYDDLTKAGEMLATNTTFYTDMNEQQLQEVVSANAPALSLARAAMSNQCRVPIQYSQSYNSNHLADLAEFKRLAQAFIAEGRLAEMEKQPASAAKSYLSAFRLGNESTRGGVLIDELVGTAIRSIAVDALQKISNNIEAKSRGEIATELKTLDSEQPSWSEVLQQERNWSRWTFRGWKYEWMRIVGSRSREKMFRQVETKIETRNEAKIKELIHALESPSSPPQ